MNEGVKGFPSRDGGSTVTIPDGSITPAKLSGASGAYDVPFAAGFTGAFGGLDLAVQTYGEIVLGRDVTFSDELGYLETVCAGTAVIVDVLKNGTTIYLTPPQFAIAATALTAGVLKTVRTASAGDRLTFVVTQKGSTTAGQKLRFTLRSLLR